MGNPIPVNEVILVVMKNNSKTTNKFNKSKSRGGDSIAVSSRKFPTDAVQAVPLEVKVYNNFDKAFKAFRALVQKEKILSLYKEKQTFEKPSDKMRRKRNESRQKLFEMEMKKNKLMSEDRKESFRKRRDEDSEEN